MHTTSTLTDDEARAIARSAAGLEGDALAAILPATRVDGLRVGLFLVTALAVALFLSIAVAQVIA